MKQPIETKKTKKIIFCGYGMSGKSTILRLVSRGIVPSMGESFHATIDYERFQHVLDDVEFTIFDLSGKPAFLERFVEELAEFVFSGVAILVYVVDSTDKKDLPLVKKYLDRCVERLAQYSPEAPMFVFQHKIDLVAPNERQVTTRSLKEFLLANISRVIPYYETSVFDTSLIIAMCAVYQALLGYIPNNWLEGKIRLFT
ncbi:MAG: ADP-ribosylation factor-like protein [Promethearchaeota archaeon]